MQHAQLPRQDVHGIAVATTGVEIEELDSFG
jgi:hypothetical protein